MITHRSTVLLTAAVLGAVALTLTAFIRFDFNPLDLRSAKTESVSTVLDLMKDPQTSPNTVDVLAPNLAAARARARKLATIPQVGQAITLNEFIPDEQPAKLALIADANTLLDATLNPFQVAAAPNDGEIVASLRATAAALRGAARDRSAAAADARRLAARAGPARRGQRRAAGAGRRRAGTGAEDPSGADECFAAGVAG